MRYKRIHGCPGYVKSAGYNGYKTLCRELSIDLASQSGTTDDYCDIQPGDPVETIVNSVCANNIRAIENTMSVLNLDELEKAVAAITKATRVDFYGGGSFRKCGNGRVQQICAHQ